MAGFLGSEPFKSGSSVMIEGLSPCFTWSFQEVVFTSTRTPLGGLTRRVFRGK